MGLLLIIIAVILLNETLALNSQYIILDKGESGLIPGYLKLVTTIRNPGTKNSLLDHDLIVLKDLPLSTLLTVTGEKLINGKYVDLGIPLRKTFCDLLATDKIIFAEMLKVGNLTSKCPVKEGHYVVRGYSPNSFNIPVPLPSGTYNLIVEYRIQGKATALKFAARILN